MKKYINLYMDIHNSIIHNSLKKSVNYPNIH